MYMYTYTYMYIVYVYVYTIYLFVLGITCFKSRWLTSLVKTSVIAGSYFEPCNVYTCINPFPPRPTKTSSFVIFYSV